VVGIVLHYMMNKERSMKKTIKLFGIAMAIEIAGGCMLGLVIGIVVVVHKILQ
jgi:hypothetical protein